MRAHAAVAQLVEQRIRNAKVASSTPASGTGIKRTPFCMKKIFGCLRCSGPGWGWPKMMAMSCWN
jgi:hypothetical protein